MISVSNWFFWALLSAVFAALTAIFAKVGLQGMDSDLATLVRTFVIMAVLIVLYLCTSPENGAVPSSSRQERGSSSCFQDWRQAHPGYATSEP